VIAEYDCVAKWHTENTTSVHRLCHGEPSFLTCRLHKFGCNDGFRYENREISIMNA
jgi:hypothetical protein